MSRRLLLFFISSLAFATLPSTAWGQFGQPDRAAGGGSRFRSTSSAILSRPTVSPYLALTDLTGSGNVDTSRNYFTQVRPRLDDLATQRSNQQAMVNLQNGVASLRSSVARQSQGPGRATGHPTRFSTYSHYYPGLGR